MRYLLFKFSTLLTFNALSFLSYYNTKQPTSRPVKIVKQSLVNKIFKFSTPEKFIFLKVVLVYFSLTYTGTHFSVYFDHIFASLYTNHNPLQQTNNVLNMPEYVSVTALKKNLYLCQNSSHSLENEHKHLSLSLFPFQTCLEVRNKSGRLVRQKQFGTVK